MCQIPLAWTLAFGNGWQVSGVFWSIPLAELLITLMGVSMFVRGKWKEQKI
jgi:Na+-driven multidrug efflux pump